MNPTFVTAVQHHQAGQLAEADRLYAQVLAAEPNHVHALHLRGALAHAAGRHAEAVDLIGRALALDEQPDFHHNIGLALSALGRRREAADHWARAVAINPDHAAARLNLGNVLREQGQIEEAIAHYNRVIALQPGFLAAYLNLAVALLATGRLDQALAVVVHSFGIREMPESRALFVSIVRGLAISADNAALRGLLVRALDEGWTAPALLAPASIELILRGPASALIVRAAQAWPARLPRVELFGSSGPAANDPLLDTLMRTTVVCNAALEKFLSGCRFALLEAAEAAPDENSLGFACGLAQQCFINEYAYVTLGDEEARAAQLRSRLEAALASGADVPPLWIATVAAYFPLSDLGGADALLARAWPTPIASLLTQQIRAPREEAALHINMPQLTPIEDATSRAVQAQYEANPYPRWVRTAEPRRYASIDAYLGEAFPSAPFRASAESGGLDILIAGCGTGQHAVMTARQYAGARVLAIDLSRASLAYASARTHALGLDSIEYAQADIMRLGALDRTFDLIESNGVLHHMADPYAGWRVLLSLLRPGGFMRIALYSEIARWGVVAARALIAEQRYGSTPAEIRRFRHDLMQRDDDVARNIMWFNDFYSLSECRDLVFHTQEHRMTLPAIKAFLAGQSLQFLGLEVDRETARQYAAQFPDDTAMIDLDCWHAFEQDNPHTFANMYRFWVQKAG